MRTAMLVFFYGCLCAGLWWAFAAWARRSVTEGGGEMSRST